MNAVVITKVMNGFFVSSERNIKEIWVFFDYPAASDKCRELLENGGDGPSVGSPEWVGKLLQDNAGRTIICDPDEGGKDGV